METKNLSLIKTLIQKVQDLKENKNLSVTEIGKVIGISRPTILQSFETGIKLCPINRVVQTKETKSIKIN